MLGDVRILAAIARNADTGYRLLVDRMLEIGKVREHTWVPRLTGVPRANITKRHVYIPAWDPWDAREVIEACAAITGHEVAHLNVEPCTDSGRHRRDARALKQWACLECERLATSWALMHLPATRGMHRELAAALWTYINSTPAPDAVVRGAVALTREIEGARMERLTNLVAAGAVEKDRERQLREIRLRLLR